MLVGFVPPVDVYYKIKAWVSVRGAANSRVSFADCVIESQGQFGDWVNSECSTSGVLHSGTQYFLQVNGAASASAGSDPFGYLSVVSSNNHYFWELELILSDVPLPPDSDNDGVPDSEDAYPNISLDGRLDTDHDGIPNLCDPDCVLTGMSEDIDDDNDNWLDINDNCPLVENFDQADSNKDGIGNACDPDDDGVPDDIDNCPSVSNSNQWNFDSSPDGGDACDDDDDNDFWPDVEDNCPLIANPGQDNTNGGPRGDACYQLPAGC